MYIYVHDVKKCTLGIHPGGWDKMGGLLEKLSTDNMESSFVVWTYDKAGTLMMEESQAQMLPGHRSSVRTGFSTESNSKRQKLCDSYCGPVACLPLPRLLAS